MTGQSSRANQLTPRRLEAILDLELCAKGVRKARAEVLPRPLH